MDHPTELIKIPIMEMFDTLQGEGYHSGSPAYFVRTGGCDVGCVWCDVKESWDASSHPKLSIPHILDNIKQSKAGIVVITGGEPFMYDLTELTTAIRNLGKKVNVETAGVYPITGTWDWICFSPKKFKKPLEAYYQKADELKVVIFHPSDFEWAETHASKMHPAAKLFLQPEWSKSEILSSQIIRYVKENPHWRLSLQTHKYLNIP